MFIQALLFPINQWTIPKINKYLKDKEFTPIKELHKNNKYYRQRLIPPLKGFKYITEIYQKKPLIKAIMITNI